MMNKKRICIAVPNTGNIHKSVVFALLRLQMDTRYELRIILPTWSPSEYNRARIMQEFIEKGEDYLLMIDSDNPPKNNPLDLIAYEKDIIACPTPIWHYNTKDGESSWYWNALDWNESGDGWQQHTDMDGLQEVDCVGSGCIIISRRTALMMKDNQAWVRQWDDQGYAVIGSDYSFCQKAKALGLKIWTHYDYPCDHFKEMSLLEIIDNTARMVDDVRKGG